MIMNDAYCYHVPRDLRFGHIGEEKKQRIYVSRTNEDQISGRVLVSCDKDVVIINGNKFPICCLCEVLDLKQSYICLTIREKMILKEELSAINIVVFEKMYPVFEVFYVSSAEINIRELKKNIASVHAENLPNSSLGKFYSDKYLYSVERKLRFKNSNDYFFSFSDKKPYREVFKFNEERDERVVIALDFNAMFPSCMSEKYMDPRSIKYKYFGFKLEGNDKLTPGLYNVVLSNPLCDFIKNYHPFRIRGINGDFLFKLDDEKIHSLLFYDEVEYYRKFFGCVFVIEGFVSDVLIDHPLFRVATKIYKKRKSASGFRKKIKKFEMLMLNSSINQKVMKSITFDDFFKLVEFVNKEFYLGVPNTINPLKLKIVLEALKLANIKINDDKYRINFNNYKDGTKVNSLFRHVISKSRIRMLKTMESLLEFPSLDICYANVDSIHISILQSDYDLFLNGFSSFLGDELGELKIEVVAKKAHWFDVGRYWLIDESGDVIQFKNFGLRASEKSNAYLKNRKCYGLTKTPFGFSMSYRWINLYNTFTYGKKLCVEGVVDNISFDRYHFNEVENFKVAGESVCKEILKSKSFKIDMFNNMATI